MAASLSACLDAICRRNGLVAMYVFGSRAAEIAARVVGAPMPSEHPDSDVDVGVEPRRGRVLSARARVRLAQSLEETFAVERVDLVVLPQAEAFLAADVVRGDLLGAPDPDAEAEAQLYYLRRAADLAPFLREQWEATVGSRL